MSETATIELHPTHPDLPGCYVVTGPQPDGTFGWHGDVELQANGQWVGDVTLGNGPPSKPYDTLAEAVSYVVNGGREPVTFSVQGSYYDGPLDV